jgi:hypothetical protein
MQLSKSQKFYLCYTDIGLLFMDVNQQIWRNWSDRLQRWGLSEVAASLLESFGPLTLLGSQVLHMCQPFLQGGAQDAGWKALTQMLEDSEETQAFVTFLREDAPL